VSKFKDLTAGISTQVAKLRKEMPDVMNGFSALAQAATKDGVLDKKTKELVAIALAVANHCPGCIGFHAQTLVKLGTTREELLETLGMAIYMGGGPSLMYAAEVLEAFEEFNT
jgi:AhpD family alkylhydroperoxidase